MNVDEAIELIKKERQRQVSYEGWSPEHDDLHDKGELAMAAACYAAPEQVYTVKVRNDFYGFHDAWPWDKGWDKRDKHDRQKQLVIAGALVIAELERLSRIKD